MTTLKQQAEQQDRRISALLELVRAELEVAEQLAADAKREADNIYKDIPLEKDPEEWKVEWELWANYHQIEISRRNLTACWGYVKNYKTDGVAQ